MNEMYVQFQPLFAEIDKLLSKGSVKLAVEGGSASGKTTLSSLLCQMYDCTVFHTDDFFLRPEQRTEERYSEPGGNLDRERIITEVLIPLCNDEPVSFRRFSCSEMKLQPALTVIPKKLTVIEGAYSMHPELAGYYDFSVFLDVSPDLQKERIMKRNTPVQAEVFFNKWIPLENRYFSVMNVRQRCDMIITVE